MSAHRRPQQQPRQPFFVAAAAIAAASWYLTPMPAAISALVVGTIPITQDVALGAVAVRSARYRLLPGCRPGRRCVDEIGRSVVNAVVRSYPDLASTSLQYDWKFEVTNDLTVNAFAYPGGRIFVTRGLLDLCTDDELAAVIGHEVGHVLHRHSQKRLVQSRLGHVLLSALVLGDGDGVSETFGMEAAGVLLKHASTLSTMTYSRANEFEADEVGWFACTALRRAGGACRGDSLQTFFRKLDGGQQGTAWHSTHPGSADRIATLDSLQSKYDEYEHSTASHWRQSADEEAFRRVFAPSSLQVGGGGGGGGSGALASLGGALASMIPAEAQRALLVGALWQGAALLEGVWNALVADAAAHDDRRSNRGDRGGGKARPQGQQQRPYRPAD